MAVTLDVPLGFPLPEPSARTTDLTTSHAAAASVRGTQNLRSRLTVLLRDHPQGMTHEQIVVLYTQVAYQYGWPTATAQGIRSRIKELERQGVVKHDGTPTERTRNGRLTHRWFLVTDRAEQSQRAAEIKDRARPDALLVIPSGLSSNGPVKALAGDIKASRRSGSFTAEEMAAFLLSRGWTR